MKTPILLLESTESSSVEIAPGETFGLAPASPESLKAPSFAICRMMRLGNGDYRPVPVEWAEWVNLREGVAEKLGSRLSRQTLHRLWRNGYIQMRQPSPQVVELHLGSLIDHLQAVRNDPAFWSRPAGDGTKRTRRQAYSRDIY